MMELIDIFFEATDIHQFILSHPVSVPRGEVCAVTGMGFPENFTDPGFVDGNEAVWKLTVPAFEPGNDVFKSEDDSLAILADSNIDLISVYFYTWCYYEDSAINILETVKNKKSELVRTLAMSCVVPIEVPN